MTRDDEAKLNTLQTALEAEEVRITTQLYHVRRSLEHLRVCRHELNTGKPLLRKEQTA